ncbi:MAG: ATP-binding cassette domain-containing protein [Lentisphaerae bacterium]|nr:ATP-binding cassette domain-containing protein [Lentisphaerota bacterium]
MGQSVNGGYVSLRDAALGYRGCPPVLASVTLVIREGEFIVIGGANGGGKSTLLKTLAGLLPVLSGTLELAGVRFGYVPQQAAIEPPLPVTALELVQLGASAVFPHGRRFRRQELDRHRQCLRDCEAEDLAPRVFGELSGGQRQRVLMARALAIQPDVLLLDEPTAGVDRVTQQIMGDLLGRLNRTRRLTVVLVTHERKPFDAHATRCLQVGDGVMVVDAGRAA